MRQRNNNKSIPVTSRAMAVMESNGDVSQARGTGPLGGEEITIRFRRLLEITQVSRSKYYELTNPSHANYDPSFPVGFPIYDSPNSPLAWYRNDAEAWVARRSKKARPSRRVGAA